MKVRVKYYSFLREAVGKTEEIVQLTANTTINGLVRSLLAVYGQKLESRLMYNGEIAPHVRVFVNNSLVMDYEITLQENDEVFLFFAVAGG